MTTTSSTEATPDERAAVDANPWFAGLPVALRAELFARGVVRRVRHGTLLASRGQPGQEWFGIARGAVRLSSVSLSGRQITLAYARPGVWLGDTALIDGLPHAHDLNAQGETTLLGIRKQDFRAVLAAHPGLTESLLQLDCRRLRALFERIESFATLPLPARLAQQLLALARDFGSPDGDVVRIALQLSQEDLAQLLGASRQRVNRELKNLEREGALRVETAGIVVLSTARLLASVTATG